MKRLTDMPEKDPTTYSLITYVWVTALAAWGGLVSYLKKHKSGVVQRFSVNELIGELVTSSFAGVITFWLCELGEIDPLLSAVFIAISGHMSARIIFLIENSMEKRLLGKIETENEDP